MKRLAKTTTSTVTASVPDAIHEDPEILTSTKDSKEVTREAYDLLLKTEATSTRTTWDEFRRKWKKDRKFFGFGSDRDREKVFRAWIKDLGESEHILNVFVHVLKVIDPFWKSCVTREEGSGQKS